MSPRRSRASAFAEASTNTESPIASGIIEDRPGIAQRLKVSVRHIDQMVAANIIPAFRIGRSVRFDLGKVLSALEARQKSRIEE